MAGPPSEASLYALVTKADAAFGKCRWARAADLFKRAALQASALYTHDSLVTVKLQESQADFLQCQSKQPGVSVAEQRALLDEAWALVREGTKVVSRRHASDTLGHNKCRPDEVQYITKYMASCIPDGFNAAHRARCLELAVSNASWFGVSVAMYLARHCLCRLHSTAIGSTLPPLSAPERVLAEQFVLQALDYLALTRALIVPILGEPTFVNVVQLLLASPAMEPSFRAAMEARWTSPDVVASLRMRGGGEQHTAFIDEMVAERQAAQRADLAEHGLLVCALPGCDKQEVTVREFKVCSACRAVAYCSAEHGGLHWAGGHKHECKDLKAAGAKPARAV